MSFTSILTPASREIGTTKLRHCYMHIEGVSKKRQHLIFMNIRCYKSQFTIGSHTQLFCDDCADRIR